MYVKWEMSRKNLQLFLGCLHLPITMLIQRCCSCCSVTQLCPTLCNPMDCSVPHFPDFRHLLELAQTHIHWMSDAIQTFCSLLPLSPPAFYLTQYQGLFQWADSSHQGAKVLKLQLQWILPMNPQGWISLGLTGLISLQTKGLSGVFINTTVQKYHFFGAQFSL